jgi:hypothetical protein
VLGLDGAAPVRPGLYFPDVLLEPGPMLERLEAFGVRFRRSDTAISAPGAGS